MASEEPIFGIREAYQKLRVLEFDYDGSKAHLVQSQIHPSLWLNVEGSIGGPGGSCIPTTFLDILEPMLRFLIPGKRTLNDALINAVQQAWNTSTPEHLGPDTCSTLPWREHDVL